MADYFDQIQKPAQQVAKAVESQVTQVANQAQNAVKEAAPGILHDVSDLLTKAEHKKGIRLVLLALGLLLVAGVVAQYFNNERSLKDAKSAQDNALAILKQAQDQKALSQVLVDTLKAQSKTQAAFIDKELSNIGFLQGASK